MKLNSKGYFDTGYVKYITDKEFKEIRDWFEKRLESPSTKLCLKILMYMGLRNGEAVVLKRENFNEDFSLLTYILEKSGQPKDRIIPNFLQKELKKHYRKYKKRMIENYLFFASYRNQSKNKHLQTSTIRLKFKQMRKALSLEHTYYTRKDGIKLFRISPHTLRHYAIYRYYLSSGNCMLTAQQIIGHKKMETTARYINMLASKNVEAKVIEKAFKF